MSLGWGAGAQPAAGPAEDHEPCAERCRRLEQRLHEVLEDNARMAASLNDSRSWIEQLQAENTALRNRVFSHGDGLPLPSIQSAGTMAEAIAGRPIKERSDIASYSISGASGFKRPAPGRCQATREHVYGPQSAPASAVGYSDAPLASRGCSVQQLPGLESITGARGRCACQQASGGFQLQHPNTFPRANAEAKTPEDADSAPGSADSKQRAAGAGSPCAGMEGAAARIPGKRRKRHHDIASKVRSVQPVPRDRDGNYEMPVQVGVLMVLRLGRVVWDRDVFHNERYIWPVGYTVQREYYSMVDPDREVIYTCWVSEGKDAPLFHIEAEDMPDSPVTAPTATGAWTTVLRRVNQIRHRVHSNSASGPDYFGFSHPTIAKMIQDLAGSDKCRAYVRQHFVEMKERHVRGVLKKGRGGRPPAELFSRGQRALKASSGKLAQQQDQARRISVATLTEGHTEGPR